MTECGAIPAGRTWPVCAKRKNHLGHHESADFYWYGESTDFYRKPDDGPPGDDPDAAEAQRIAEQYDDAAGELARIEAAEARDD